MGLIRKKRAKGEPYGHSKGRQLGSKQFYRPVWSGGKWDEFVKSRSKGALLQVCCGGSWLGQARVDFLPLEAVNVRADMLRLPFARDSFETVACDPPYDLSFPDRVHLQRELARVTRKRILFKAPWIPRATGWALGETVLIASHTCQNVAVLSVLERKAETGNLF